MDKLLNLILLNKLRQENNSSGGKSYPPDWSLIGYEDTPENVLNSFNYSKNIYDNWDSSVTSLNNKYLGNQNLIIFPNVDLTNVINFQGCFNSSALASISDLYIPKATNLSNMFRACPNLISAPKIFNINDNPNNKDISTMFANCTNLKNIPVYNINNIRFITNIFGGCPSLTDESINNILQMCINIINYSGQRTLATMGFTSRKLSSNTNSKFVKLSSFC